MNAFTATYDPGDNKMRLRSTGRLDRETYDRVKAAGFGWAPKQELFVAPMWTPEREDILLELCGEIGDEDTSLVDRAEDRAERFEEYSDKREADAERAHAAVASIADNIPLGQPIMVGHHSEKRARKDAERIRNGMAKAVRMWETSKYWERRAKGALFHAKYKELPGVRQRRIKGLEADRRKHVRARERSMALTKLWAKDGLTLERATAIAGRFEYGVYSDLSDGKITAEEARERATKAHTRTCEWSERWIAHIDLRLAYERAMLGDVPEPVKRKRELAPMANYPGEGFIHMTKAEYAAINRDYKGTRDVRGARVRSAMSHMCPGGEKAHGHGLSAVYLTDSKRVDPPSEGSDVPPRFKERMPEPEMRSTRVRPAPEPNKFDALKEQLKAGVQVVSAPQLFPTPPELAARMVEIAGIEAHHTVLEPSAGTGNIIRAIERCARVSAIEINSKLVDSLVRVCEQTRCANFLECTVDELGTFDRIVANPPFADGADIEHIEHALTFLKPGGKLVAICANGPRQNTRLRPIVEQRGGTWEELPADTFKDSGTSARTVLLTIGAI